MMNNLLLFGTPMIAEMVVSLMEDDTLLGITEAPILAPLCSHNLVETMRDRQGWNSATLERRKW